MSPADLKSLLQSVEEISRKTGQYLVHERTQFNGKTIEQKGINNLVSHVDKEAEKQFVTALSEILPEAGFIAEEGTGQAIEGGLNWVVDPLDGTTNFIHNIPFFCTSVALVQDRKPLLGVIFDPVHNEMFAAAGEEPARLNGETIHVSTTEALQNMLIVTGFPYEDKGLLQCNLQTIGDLTRESRSVRRMGSAALDMCYVACGRFDGFYEYGLNAWDVAAGTCIVRNAGGLVGDFYGLGDPLFDGSIIAASTPGFDALRKVVQKNFKRI